MLKYVNVVEPMAYDDFLQLLSTCFLVITDSGGLQEESSFFMKKCIVCREKTERVEGMGIFSFMTGPKDLNSLFIFFPRIMLCCIVLEASKKSEGIEVYILMSLYFSSPDITFVKSAHSMYGPDLLFIG